jgi:hypothetical protein
MRSYFLRIAAAALGLMILVTVIPGLAEDYLIIKRKDGTTQKVPLNFDPDQIESLQVEPGQAGVRQEKAEEQPRALQPEPERPGTTQVPKILRQQEPGPMRGPTQALEQNETEEPVQKPAPAKRETAPSAPKRIETAQPPAPGSGFSVNIYKLPENVRSLPDYSAFRPTGSATTDKIDVDPAKGQRGPAALPEKTDGLGMRFIGVFMTTGEGIFKWRLNSKDGARLHIDDKTVIENDGIHDATSKVAYVHLAEGTHTIILDSFNSQGSPVLKLYLQPPMGEEQLFSLSKGAVGWKEPEKPYDVLWGQVYFVPKGNYPEGPDFSRLSPIGRLIAPELNITGNEGFVGLPGKKDMVGIRYQGFFNVQGAGIFAFRLVSDSFARLTIGKQSIAETTSGTKSEAGQLGWAFLQQGSYPITLDYFNPQGDPQLRLYVTPPTQPEELFAPAKNLEGFASDSGNLSFIPGFVYFLKPNTKAFPNFNQLTPAGMFFSKAIDYPLNRGTREFPGVPKREEWLGLRFYVKFSLGDQEAGTYKFRLVSDDSARLIVGKKEVIKPGAPGKLHDVSGSVDLPAGSHEMFLDYMQTTGPSALQLYITPPGGEEKIFAFQ